MNWNNDDAEAYLAEIERVISMEKLSFKTLNDCYAVVIPMLQRDYAYGRIDESEKEIAFE